MNSELQSFFVIIAAATLAPILVDMVTRVKLPVVVIEIALGIIIGPQVLAWAGTSPVVEAFSLLGLAFLFFLAGFEIDFEQIKGKPIKLASSSWLLGLVVALALSFVLNTMGIIDSYLHVGVALTTTAIGVLLPM